MMELQNPFSLIIASFILFFFLLKIVKGPKTQNTLPPGPSKLPLIGNIHQLAGSLPHLALRDLAKKYGPLMHIQLGQVSAVVISSPRLAKEVMKTHDLAFADRPQPLATKFVFYGPMDIGFSNYGDYWRQMKKIVSAELLTAKKVRSFAYIREQELHHLLESIRSSLGSQIDFSEKIFAMLNTITCRATFGNNCKDQAALLPLIKQLVTLGSGFTVADLFPGLEFLHVLSGMRPALLKMHTTLDKIIDDILIEHRAKRSNGEAGEEDLVDVLYRLKEGGGLEVPITHDNIKAVLMDMFGAPTDTSSTTIEWAMAELMRNPRVMEKAQAEVRQAFKGKEIITETDTQGLHYLKLVIKESLRMHPPNPILPRECREQRRIDGYDIPVKTKVLINIWAISRDPDFWEDPESFKPERFENNSVDFMGTDFKFIPFGSGRRMCPGISFALTALETPLAQLLYYFNWKLPNGMKPEGLDMTEAEGAVATKKVNLHLIPTSYFPVQKPTDTP